MYTMNPKQISPVSDIPSVTALRQGLCHASDATSSKQMDFI